MRNEDKVTQIWKDLQSEGLAERKKGKDNEQFQENVGKKHWREVGQWCACPPLYTQSNPTFALPFFFLFRPLCYFVR